MTKMIDGEVITDNELADLRRMIEHDCREFAGVWFEMPGRSEKCRRTWADVGAQLGQFPVEVFVNLKWVQFIDMVKQWYGSRIPKEPEDVQKRLHRACVIMNLLGEMPEARDVLQMEIDSKAFHGDKFENRHIAETYGNQAAALDSILRGTRTIN
jgi:hypothetical protein